MEKKQDILGYVGLGISSLGAIASIVTNNIAFASVPLTLGIGCNLLSRQQSVNSLIEAHNAQQVTINDLSQKLETNQTQTEEQLIKNHAQLGNLIERIKLTTNEHREEDKQKLIQEIQRLDLQNQELNKLVNTIENVENVVNLSQNIRSEENPALFFYERGVGYENLGNKEGALKDYTEAIKEDSTLAKAYHKRGIVYLEQDNRQKAVDDLRKAALLYFEQGDIDSYHQAREMSRNVHDLRKPSYSNNGHVEKQMIVGNDLFS